MQLGILNGYLAYSRYQGIAQQAHDIYMSRPIGQRFLVWADIKSACIALSLTEQYAFPPEN